MNNPYASPQATVIDHHDNETYEPRVFAIHGRIGRLRYLAYGMGLSMLFMMIAGGLAGALAGASGNNAAASSMGTLIMLAYVPMLALSLIMMKRRFNDLDKSGWWSLLMLVPLLNVFLGLYLTFAPGTQGSNRYGPAPAKNSSGVVILGLLIPFVAMIGIMAAIAIPAYQDYVKRAKAAQAQQHAPQETWQQSQ